MLMIVAVLSIYPVSQLGKFFGVEGQSNEPRQKCDRKRSNDKIVCKIALLNDQKIEKHMHPYGMSVMTWLKKPY